MWHFMVQQVISRLEFTQRLFVHLCSFITKKWNQEFLDNQLTPGWGQGKNSRSLEQEVLKE